jgi:hypothetical protein
MHLGRHGGEGKDSLDAKLAGMRQELTAKDVFADRRLRFA